MQFETDHLLSLIHEENDTYGLKLISDTILEKSRWSILRKIVFEFENRFYTNTYSVGATEYQEDYLFGDDEFVECKEVFPKKVEITIYE